jgi:hypothetical protein
METWKVFKHSDDATYETSRHPLAFPNLPQPRTTARMAFPGKSRYPIRVTESAGTLEDKGGHTTRNHRLELELDSPRMDDAGSRFRWLDCENENLRRHRWRF